MGFGRVIAAAAAAATAPVVREHLHRQHSDEDMEGRGYYAPAAVSAVASSSAAACHDPGELDSEEMARRPLLSPAPSSGGNSTVAYGTILNRDDGADSARLRASPERYRRDSWLDRVPEEDSDAVVVVAGELEDSEAEADEWDLEEYGYYSGSYQTKVAIYGLVPLTCIVTFLLLANLVRWIWAPRSPPPATLPRSFPAPLPEVLLSAAFFALTHALRAPLYTAAATLLAPIWDTLAFNAAHVLLSQALRLAALALLRVRHDMAYPLPTWRDAAFTRVWWLGLGWAAAEAATGVVQGYQQLALYRSVMVPVERVRKILDASRGPGGSRSTSGGESTHGSREYMPLSPRTERREAAVGANGSVNRNGTGDGNGDGGEARDGGGRRGAPISVEDAVRMAVDQDVEQLLHLQERKELEEVYGLPVIYVPVFVPCLQRLDGFLTSLGYTLVLAWAYLRSPLAFPAEYEVPPVYSSRALAVAFPVVVLAHLGLSLLHSPLVLPRIGVHTAAYVGLLVGLGGFFTGLGLWGALS
ncbi:hypothetical protein C8Q78DRAFT_1123395 [Trametes maxima]|nr:hypothetical protein C8Q78DRAFT_1123395 [Trametes maxima]